MERTCYDILGVRPDASRAEIRAAFRRLARRCHPDTAAAGQADRVRFQELLAAYRLLSSPSSRIRYDSSLAAARGAGRGRWLWRRIGRFAVRLRRLAALSGSGRAPDPVRRPIRRRPVQGRSRSRSRPQAIDPSFEQVLAARLRAEASCYVLCEDGIIRKHGGIAEGGRTFRSRRAGLSGALWLCWGGLVVLMVSCWELVRGEVVLR